MEIIVAPPYNGRQGDNLLLRRAIQMGQKYTLKYQRIKKRQIISPGKVAQRQEPDLLGWGEGGGIITCFFPKGLPSG